MEEILENKYAGLVKANSRIYFLKYCQKYPFLWTLHTFLYSSLFRFVLTMASTSTHGLDYKKVCLSYEHISF